MIKQDVSPPSGEIALPVEVEQTVDKRQTR